MSENNIYDYDGEVDEEASLYQQWLAASSALTNAKKLELDLRNKICAMHLSDKLEGSKTIRHNSFILKPTAKLTRSIDKEMLEAIWDDLSDSEKECIEYKPALKLTDYKKIEEEGGLLTDAITVKPAQASLKIIIEEDE